MKYVVLLIAMIFNISCLAQNNDHKRMDCSQATISAELDDCIKDNMNRSNKILKEKLNKFKQQVIQDYQADNQLGKALVNTVLDAQKAWLSFRDKNCKVIAFEIEEGTPAYITTINSCVIEMNDERMKQLNQLLN